ncbi:hypothetical protein PAXINDRAFT_164622 [Paxillus involutus ATCC 200175]|uniref:Uncharacterized protein n=1 Tax=Paxillus involutus ATCC 200175 TaxID=664439 RepID=A0A0C9T7P2_PAXIN|nr:hypothetical protein PAXINDRAFT_164622 [Paxillus involutus ATCC 200175]
MEDPNLAVEPDFLSEEYADHRLNFIDADHGIDNERAARILSKVWTLNNAKDKERWTARAAELALLAAEEKRISEEAEALRLQSIADDQQAAIKEERQKNKLKYAPVRDVDVPNNTSTLPSQYAARLLKKGVFCPLFYFTNKGLREASHSSLTSDAEALVLIQGEAGSHTFMPALAAQPASPSFVTDENLTWEQFNEATPRMILTMRTHEWPEDRINMHLSNVRAGIRQWAPPVHGAYPASTTKY